jgi:hypothetical protein
MSLRFGTIFLVACIFASFHSVVQAKQVRIGWLEEVLVNGSKYPILAKIDTGADNSSINAKDVTLFKKEGKKWVKFSVINRYGQDTHIERPIRKTTRVKTKDGKYQRRQVIEIDICIHAIKKRVIVNLVDRSHFKYQMLIGRSFLRPEFLVDANEELLHKPDCK